MSATLALVALVPGALVGGMAAAYARAAAVRRRRRAACPFEDDDDEARPLAREVVDVLRESLALVRVLLAGLSSVPPAWRGLEVRPGVGPVVVLVAARALPAASLALLGRRLARDLGASIHVAPGPTAAAEGARADRLATQLAALARRAPGRALVAVGHGDGGLVARRAAAALRLPDLRVVTVATDHQGPGPAPRAALVDRVDVLNLYSLHDPLVVPAARAYLAGAYNVVVRDEGHCGLVLGARPYALLLEGLGGLLPHAVAS